MLCRTPLTALVLCLATSASASAQQTTTRLVHDEEAGEFVVEIGPMHVPVGAMEPAEAGQHAHAGGGSDPHAVHGGAVFAPVEIVTFPVGGYLHAFSYEVVDGEGRALPVEVLHHLNLINPDNRELFLPISQRMLAVGKETGSQGMPWLLLGYPVPGGTRMAVSAMLHNPTGKEHHGVMVRVHLEYTPVGRPWPLFNVYPFQMDVAFPAGDKSFDLPPGRSAWSYEASPSIEGRIMAVGGHFHEHAVSLTFEDVTTGKLIWEGFPIEDDDGNLTGVTLGRLYRTLGEKVYPDHVYRVTVTYENPFPDTLYAGGMGVIGGVFMPSGGGMWPRADTANELYALDRMHYMRQVRGKYEEIMALEDVSQAPGEGQTHSH